MKTNRECLVSFLFFFKNKSQSRNHKTDGLYVPLSGMNLKDSACWHLLGPWPLFVGRSGQQTAGLLCMSMLGGFIH